MMDALLRVAIVDDHPMFRMGLAVAIGEMDGVELVGEAADVDGAHELVASDDARRAAARRAPRRRLRPRGQPLGGRPTTPTSR